ncbi:MAG: radical SAM protein [Candidatus Omnitrophica bacterium]|nr:radical SAM protein [Candidatus Omnitrophota bacterium]
MNIYFIKTQKILAKTQINLGDYVINPYRGCEFGCLYCYSQENKNLENQNFFDSIGIKINASKILEHQLFYTKPKRILLGSTTECFQYKELEYKITEQILIILNKHQIPYIILTKSHLISKYLSLIKENPLNKIYFTFNYSSNQIIKLLEKKTPTIEQRLKTIEDILKKNINLRIHIGPFMPYIEELDRIFKLLPKKIKEIDIELYHHKMGNLKKILEILHGKIETDAYFKFVSVYKNSKSYLNFAQNLNKKILELKQLNPEIKFFYIVPDFDAFYKNTIDYQRPL